MKTSPKNEAKAIYSELAGAMKSATVICVLAKTQAGRGVGNLHSGRKERFQGCADGRLLAREAGGRLSRSLASYVIG